MSSLCISRCRSWKLFSFNYNQIFLSSVQFMTVDSVLQHMCSVFKLSSLQEAQTKQGFYLKHSYLAVIRRSQVLCYTCCKTSHSACVTANQTWESSACAEPKEQMLLHSEQEQQWVLTRPPASSHLHKPGSKWLFTGMGMNRTDAQLDKEPQRILDSNK